MLNGIRILRKVANSDAVEIFMRLNRMDTTDILTD